MDKANRFNKKIYIIGEENLQNEFLKYIINKEIKSDCTIYGNIKNIPSNEDSFFEQFLILIDCNQFSFEEILKDIYTYETKTKEKYSIGLFNLLPGTGVEKKALAKNIKGFFFSDDNLELFVKGISCVFKGEVWISRQILLECVMESFEEKRKRISSHTSLTQREIEILTLLSMGAKNEEIANKVNISTNTVKTHIYNIFKKIKVPNRLHAALWAAKHL